MNLAGMRFDDGGGYYGGTPIFEKGGIFGSDVANAGSLQQGDANGDGDGNDQSDIYVVKHPSASLQVTLGDANSAPGSILDKFANQKLTKQVCATSRPGQFDYCRQKTLRGITGRDQDNFSVISGSGFENNI